MAEKTAPTKTVRRPHETLRTVTMPCRVSIQLKAASDAEAREILTGILQSEARVESRDGIRLTLKQQPRRRL